MKTKILLTSFQTWLPHQISNSSDDLLEIIQEQKSNSNSLLFLRKLPVDIKLASQQVIKTIEAVEPQAVLCCGMAESRKELTIESRAVDRGSCIFTRVNLEKLNACLGYTKISHDAGKFVCEGLYYEVLKYIDRNNLDISCLFVHVPVLNPGNAPVIQQDFMAIIQFVLSNNF